MKVLATKAISAHGTPLKDVVEAIQQGTTKLLGDIKGEFVSLHDTLAVDGGEIYMTRCVVYAPYTATISASTDQPAAG